jgi:hypothetical protein
MTLFGGIHEKREGFAPRNEIALGQCEKPEFVLRFAVAGFSLWPQKPDCGFIVIARRCGLGIAE